MQIADKYYLNYLAKFIADNRYYRDNFEKIIDYRDKKYCTDNGNPNKGHIVAVSLPYIGRIVAYRGHT